VSVNDSGNFTKTGGGIIYGQGEEDLSNTAGGGSSHGHAAYAYTSPSKRRNGTADVGDDMDSSATPPAGGWEP
jgi:hypothetical protein